MPNPLPPQAAFRIANGWLAAAKARALSQDWLRNHSSEDAAAVLSAQLSALKPLHDQAALSWMQFLKKGPSALDEPSLSAAADALLMLSRHYEGQAAELEPLIQRRGEQYSHAECCQILAGYMAWSHYGELSLKAASAMQRELAQGAEAALQAEMKRDYAHRIDTQKRYAMLLDKGAPLEIWDARMLRAHASVIPQQLRTLAAQLDRAASDAQDGAAELPSEAVDEWQAFGIAPDSALLWLHSAFLAEEANAWRSAGITDPLEALEWRAQGVDAEEAAPWATNGFRAEEAACWVVAGATDPQQAAELAATFVAPDSLRPWVRAGISVPDTLALRRKGIQTPDQALATAEAGPVSGSTPPPLSGLMDKVAEAAGTIIPPDLPGMAPAVSDDPWVKAGVRREVASAWLSAMFSLKEALPWIDRGMDAATASRWQAAGVLHAEKAAAWFKAGVQDPDTAQWLERRLKLAGDEQPALPSAELLSLPRPGSPAAQFCYGMQIPPWKNDADMLDASQWLAKARRSLAEPELRQADAVLGAIGRDLNYLSCSATEHWALASRPVEIRCPEQLPEWKPAIEQLAEALELPKQSLSYLLSTSPGPDLEAHQAFVYWGWSYSDIDGLPWKDSMDFSPSEGWAKRWWRKTDEWGEAYAEPKCRVGIFNSNGKNHAIVALEESLHIAAPGAVLKLAALNSRAAWRDDWDDFSRIMDLPLRKPRWMLAYAVLSDKPTPPPKPIEELEEA